MFQYDNKFNTTEKMENTYLIPKSNKCEIDQHFEF